MAKRNLKRLVYEAGISFRGSEKRNALAFAWGKAENEKKPLCLVLYTFVSENKTSNVCHVMEEHGSRWTLEGAGGGGRMEERRDLKMSIQPVSSMASILYAQNSCSLPLIHHPSSLPSATSAPYQKSKSSSSASSNLFASRLLKIVMRMKGRL